MKPEPTPYIDQLGQKNQNPAKKQSRHLKNYLAQLWRSKSGSFFGIGYFLAFLCYEANDCYQAIRDFDWQVDNLLYTLASHLLRLGYETFINMFHALLWPLWFFDQFTSQQALLTLAGLYLTYWLLRKYLKVECWLEKTEVSGPEK